MCLLLGGALLTVLTGCGNADRKVAKAQKKKAPLVRLETVSQKEIVHAIDLTGELVPVESIRISASLEGPIGFCPWREGDSVKAGEKLIQIDRELFEAEVGVADAALAVAKARLTDLEAGTRPEEIGKARQSVREAEQSAAFEQDEFKRISQLVASGALPDVDLEKARVRLTSAEARLSAARQQLGMLETGSTRTAIAVQEALVKEATAKLVLSKAHLSESVIVAPLAGTITKVFVHRGDMAAAKSPLLEMANLGALVIRCSLPEAHAVQARLGMKAEVRLDAIPEKTLTARVVRIFPELDPHLRTRPIELEVQDTADLAAGMFARIRLILKSVAAAVVVPSQAVIVSPDGTPTAFVAVQTKASRRKLRTGIEENGLTQILSGLQPGENVIVAGQEKLKDGTAIRLPKASAETKKQTGKTAKKGTTTKPEVKY
jgi:multidrug efflux pump subunit AcrA (membrane-fusion protein)